MKDYIKQFKIILDDNQQRIYRRNDSISGRVILEISKGLRLSSFKLRLHGRAKSLIRKGKSNYSGFVRETQHFIDTTITGKGKDKAFADVDLVIPAFYNYEFTFRLPSDSLPSSFESTRGNNIRYMIKAYLHLADYQRAVKSKVKFIYHQDIDCNAPEYQRQDYILRREKKFNCCCYPYGKLLLYAEIDRMAYCPGDTLKILQALADNQTNIPISSILVNLVQLVQRNAKSLKQIEKNIHDMAISNDNIEPFTSTTFRKFSFVIPDLSITNTDSNIITVRYYLKVFVRFSPPYIGQLHLKFPIVIGSIPRIKNSQKRRVRSKLTTNHNETIDLCHQIDLGSKTVTLTNINIPTITSSPSYTRPSKKFKDRNRRKKEDLINYCASQNLAIPISNDKTNLEMINLKSVVII